MPRIRFQTYFGVQIPPFKEKKLGAGSTTIRFVVKGVVPSKKNNQQAIALRGKAKQFVYGIYNKGQVMTLPQALSAIEMVEGAMIPNKEYESFLKRVKEDIEFQKTEWLNRLSDKGLAFPLQKASMTLRLYFKDRYVTDTVNKQQTIQDMLIEFGIIADDEYKCLNPIHSASACYFQELIYNIAFISLSFKL